MRRTLTLIAVFATAILLIASQGNALMQKQSPELKKDGKTNPASIPDYVAYEFFFKSLINSPAEGVRGEKRVEAFARQTGLKKEDSLLLLMDAHKVFQEIKTFDRRVKEIKDETWPNPPGHVWSQLKDIQKQKEASIVQQVEALFASYHPKMANQLRSFIHNQIKSKIKGYADKPDPGQKQRPHHTTIGMTLATFFSPVFSAATQMQGNETVYIYANAVYYGTAQAYGYGDVSATASSYGHEYYARSEMYGPCGQFESGGSNAMSDLIYNGSLCDGEFSFYCIAVQSCPIANTIFDAGDNQDTVIVNPYFVLGDFGNFSSGSVSVQTGSVTIQISVSASQGMTTTKSVQLVFGSQQQSGTTNFDISGSTTVTLAGGATGTYTATYDPTSSTNNAQIKATALLNNPQPSSAPPGILAPSSKISTSVLTISSSQ